MGLDYSHTCSDIDREKDSAKEVIHQEISYIITDEMPLPEDHDFDETWINNKVDEIWDRVDSCFEVCRETNVDMRKAADDQISDLESEIDDLKEQVNALQSIIDNI